MGELQSDVGSPMFGVLILVVEWMDGGRGGGVVSLDSSDHTSHLSHKKRIEN